MEAEIHRRKEKPKPPMLIGDAQPFRGLLNVEFRGRRWVTTFDFIYFSASAHLCVFTRKIPAPFWSTLETKDYDFTEKIINEKPS